MRKFDTEALRKASGGHHSRTVANIGEQWPTLMYNSNNNTTERNLPLYRDALSKVPRLVYVRNLDGGEDIYPDLGKIDCSSGEGCCKGKYRWLKHPTDTCLYDAFSSQLVKLCNRRTCNYVVWLAHRRTGFAQISANICANRDNLRKPTFHDSEPGMGHWAFMHSRPSRKQMHSIRCSQASITAMFR
jgi:hypothetical protein